MHRIRTGDLCRPANLLQSGTIIVSSEDMSCELFRLSEPDMVVVTRTISDMTPRQHSAVARIAGIVQRLRGRDTSAHLHQILVASGPDASRVGYVPSYWLTTVVPAKD
jgi:hypothetical protein